MSDVPVLLTVFNRVDLTRIMLDALRRMRPPILFIAADGPRPGNSTDEENCSQVRNDLQAIDWPCQVVRLFRNQNLGCDRNVPIAISEVLESYDRIIVLEDDCLPTPSFYPFCAELLERYREDTRIAMVCGSLPIDFMDSSYSYFFSRSYHGWGWATWRRAWRAFDYDMVSWPSVHNSRLLRTRFITEAEYRIWSRKTRISYLNPSRPWDAAWGYACRKEGALAIFAHRSLIKNTGIGHEQATHSGNEDFRSIWMRQVSDISFPLRHPPCILPDMGKECAVRNAVSGALHPWTRLRARIKVVPSLLVDIIKLVDYYRIIF